jgi:hypothetical protein
MKKYYHRVPLNHQWPRLTKEESEAREERIWANEVAMDDDTADYEPNYLTDPV